MDNKGVCVPVVCVRLDQRAMGTESFVLDRGSYKGCCHISFISHSCVGPLAIQKRCRCIHTVWAEQPHGNSLINNLVGSRVKRGLLHNGFILYNDLHITLKWQYMGMPGRTEIQGTHPRERRMIGSPLLLCVIQDPGQKCSIHKKKSVGQVVISHNLLHPHSESDVWRRRGAANQPGRCTHTHTH